MTLNQDPYDDLPEERPKYKVSDVRGECPICGAGFWQRAYLVNGKPSPETCSFSHGQMLRARRAAGQSTEQLTDREVEIMKLREAGKTNAQVAEQLGITTGTVKNGVYVARRKLRGEAA
jgi:DNA-binding CsgD family transcriptional regulator